MYPLFVIGYGKKDGEKQQVIGKNLTHGHERNFSDQIARIYFTLGQNERTRKQGE
jgi:hypothetical protein